MKEEDKEQRVLSQSRTCSCYSYATKCCATRDSAQIERGAGYAHSDLRTDSIPIKLYNLSGHLWSGIVCYSAVRPADPRRSFTLSARLLFVIPRASRLPPDLMKRIILIARTSISRCNLLFEFF